MAAAASSPENSPSFSDRRLRQALAECIGKFTPAESMDLSFVVRSLRSEIQNTHPAHLADHQISQLMFTILGSLGWYGPLSSIMDDPEVSDILVNGHNLPVYVQRRGQYDRTPFILSKDWIYFLVRTLCASAGNFAFDPDNPILDIRCGVWRMAAVHGTVGVNGPCFALRRSRPYAITLAQLVESGTISAQARDWLSAFVRAQSNIIIVGGTGSGKTTLLGALAGLIPPDERIVLIEETHEVTLSHANRLDLEAGLRTTLHALVRAAMRLNPSRIIVGEVRGQEALDLLNALNSGHAGSFTTIHANACREALMKLENYVLMSGQGFPVSMVRRQIAMVIDLVITMQRTADGRRQVVSIDEIHQGDSDTYVTGQIFTRVDDQLVSTGMPLSERRRVLFESQGIPVPIPDRGISGRR